MEIIATFQRALRTRDQTEVNTFSLEELKLANQQLGWRDQNADFRLALQDRIKEIESKSEVKKQSHNRALNWFITLCIGIIVGLVIFYLTKPM